MAGDLVAAYARLEMAAEAQREALEGADWEEFEATSELRNQAFESVVALEQMAAGLNPVAQARAKAHIDRIATIDRRLESLLAALAAATSSELSKLNQGIHALQAYADDPANTARFLDTAQ